MCGCVGVWSVCVCVCGCECTCVCISLYLCVCLCVCLCVYCFLPAYVCGTCVFLWQLNRYLDKIYIKFCHLYWFDVTENIDCIMTKPLCIHQLTAEWISGIHFNLSYTRCVYHAQIPYISVNILLCPEKFPKIYQNFFVNSIKFGHF